MTAKKPVSRQRHYATSPKNDKDHVEKVARQQKALDYRVSGMTYQQIGDALGVTRPTAYRYVQNALDESAKETLAKAGNLRELELSRLDKLQRVLERALADKHVAWTNGGKIVVDVDEKTGEPYKVLDHGAIAQDVNAMLKVMERRARLLGLDQPLKVEQSGSLEVTTIQHPDLSVLTDEEYAAWKAANAKLRSSMEDAYHGPKDHDDI